MRIIGGTFAGRDLTSPNDKRTRPTAEPVRAALLGALEADVKGARVLDLFAGTGALGLEAISRGATSADFVEYGPASLHALKANVAALRLTKRVRIFKKDAMAFAASLAPSSYQVAFADPPYTARVLDRLLATWRERRFAPILAVEHDRTLALPNGAWNRTIEDTTVRIYRLGAA